MAHAEKNTVSNNKINTNPRRQLYLTTDTSLSGRSDVKSYADTLKLYDPVLHNHKVPFDRLLDSRNLTA